METVKQQDLPWNIYNYDTSPYTGTDAQPDFISAFIKIEGSLFVAQLRAPADYFDYIPLISSVSAVFRACVAVSTFFSEIAQATWEEGDPHLAECWNVFKNLCRAAIAVIPFAGNITLFVFDVAQDCLIVNSLEEALKDQENVVGYALDGTIVAKSSLDQWKGLLTHDVNERSLSACVVFAQVFLEEAYVQQLGDHELHKSLLVEEAASKVKTLREVFDVLNTKFNSSSGSRESSIA